MRGTRQAVAIITGGSQGIGAGLVAGYRRRGWAVVATAHRRRADRRPLTTPAPQGVLDRCFDGHGGRAGPSLSPAVLDSRSLWLRIGPNRRRLTRRLRGHRSPDRFTVSAG